MKTSVHPFRIALVLWLALALQTGAAAQDADQVVLPPALVAAGVLDAKIIETEANPDLQAEERTKLVARYRKAFGNLKEVAANGATAAAFEETIRTSP
jgi:potassium efflux system protein